LEVSSDKYCFVSERELLEQKRKWSKSDFLILDIDSPKNYPCVAVVIKTPRNRGPLDLACVLEAEYVYLTDFK
jgi:ribosomal protein S12 methylthiotransferase accessory factor YcaO